MPRIQSTRFSKDFKILFYYSEGDRAKELLFSLEKMRSLGFDLDSVRVVIANAKLAKQHPCLLPTTKCTTDIPACVGRQLCKRA